VKIDYKSGGYRMAKPLLSSSFCLTCHVADHGGEVNSKFTAGKADSAIKTRLNDPDVYWWPSVEAELPPVPSCD